MSFASQSIYGDHELIQAMPLDTAKAQNAYLSAESPSVTLTLGDKAKLVEITVLPVGGTIDAVYAHMTDDLDAEVSVNPLSAGKSTYAIVTASRELTLSLIPPVTGSVIVYVMEA